jgi:hypothetical protein
MSWSVGRVVWDRANTQTCQACVNGSATQHASIHMRDKRMHASCLQSLLCLVSIRSIWCKQNFSMTIYSCSTLLLSSVFFLLLFLHLPRPSPICDGSSHLICFLYLPCWYGGVSGLFPDPPHWPSTANSLPELATPPLWCPSTLLY